MKTWQKIVAWCGGVGTVLTVIITMLWGVPYYIESAVKAEVKKLSDEASIPTEVTDLQNMDASIKGSIEGIRGELTGINGQLGTLATDVAATRADAKETKDLMIDFLRGR